MSTNSQHHIRVSRENYSRLKEMGKLGDSFNDVIKKLLEKETV